MEKRKTWRNFSIQGQGQCEIFLFLIYSTKLFITRIIVMKTSELPVTEGRVLRGVRSQISIPPSSLSIR